MGTVFSFDVRAPGIDRRALDDAVQWLHHVDAVFSPYRDDSVIARLAAGSSRPARLDEEVSTVLARCAALTELTDGFFSAYYNGVLDPSGYVKGWAIERASDILEDAGSRNHCVNGGGDVQCVGEAEPGRPWRVGITDPLDRSALVRTVAGAGRLAVATSGTAERGAHIIDPRTRTAPTRFASVTVIGTELADVDAYATAAFAMGAGAHAWLVALGSVNALLVDRDGTVVEVSERAGPEADPDRCAAAPPTCAAHVPGRVVNPPSTAGPVAW